MPDNRSIVLAGLAAALAVATAVALASVLSTVFFAITVAYVAYPLRQRLVARGLPRRVAVTAVTGVTLVAVSVVIVPVGYVLYRRRADLFEVLRRIPDSVTVALGWFEYVVETAQLLTAVESTLRRLAVEVARALPVLALKFAVFVLLIYGLLYRPTAVREAVDRLVPRQYHDVVRTLHDRTRSTLYAIYVL